MKPPFGHLKIVLVRPQQSGNIGAVARTIANHGFGQLVLVDPPAFDPERARWMAPHSQHIIDDALIVETLKEAISDCQFVVALTARDRKFGWPVWDVPQFKAAAGVQKPQALVFGPEDSGLSNSDLTHCHAILTLPTHAHQSLNLAQTVNVCGGHLMASWAEQQEKPQDSDNPKFTAELSHRLQSQLAERSMEVLENIGYLKNKSPIHVQNQLLRFTERARFNHQELMILLGMASKLFHSDRVLREALAHSGSNVETN
ncbi:MAG: RNA methyltransferase [Myxococcota bacterium]